MIGSPSSCDRDTPLLPPSWRLRGAALAQPAVAPVTTTIASSVISRGSGPLWVTARSRKLDGGVDDRAFGGAAKPPIVAGANSAPPSCIVGATAEEKWWATAKRGDVSG